MSVCPKIQNRYCKKCNKYQNLQVSVVKPKSSSALIKINRRRALKYLTKGPAGKFTKTPAKSTKICKKPNLQLTCSVCNSKRNWVHRRAVKFNIR